MNSECGALILLNYFFQAFLQWSIPAFLIFDTCNYLRIILRNWFGRECTMHEWVLNWIRTSMSESGKVTHIIRNAEHLWVLIVQRLLRSVGLFEGIAKFLNITLNCVWFLNKVLHLFGNKVSYFTDWNVTRRVLLFLLLLLYWLIILAFRTEE